MPCDKKAQLSSVFCSAGLALGVIGASQVVYQLVTKKTARLSSSSRARWAEMKHIVSVKQLDRQALDEIMAAAAHMQRMLDSREVLDVCKGDVLGCLFYEPSTRTSCSFQAAMMRLGGNVISITDTKNSSVSKGETLEDTIRCLSSYCDAVALRHKEVGAANRASTVSGDCTILNAGDGRGEHPTQALLDLYTILKEKGTLENLNITMIGDLKHGRTVHSLAKVLTNFKGNTIRFVSPDQLKMPTEYVEYVKKAGVECSETGDLSSVLPQTDVLYVTRIQKERFDDPKVYDQVKNAYRISKEFLDAANAKTDLTIMHPLPRVNEICTSVDSDTTRAAYFRQMKNGLYVRMALLALLMGRQF